MTLTALSSLRLTVAARTTRLEQRAKAERNSLEPRSVLTVGRSHHGHYYLTANHCRMHTRLFARGKFNRKDPSNELDDEEFVIDSEDFFEMDEDDDDGEDELETMEIVMNGEDEVTETVVGDDAEEEEKDAKVVVDTEDRETEETLPEAVHEEIPAKTDDGKIAEGAKDPVVKTPPAATATTATKCPHGFTLNCLWLDKLVAIAVDQVYSKNKRTPLTEYFVWPRSDAWEELRIRLSENPWIDERDQILLLNRATEVINYWQDEEKQHSMAEARALFPECVFMGA